MKSLEHLDEEIKDLLLLNGGDINIANYPHIIKDAEENGISQFELARRITRISNSIDWRPYNRIDKLLENIILKGSIDEKEAETIIRELQNELQRPAVINYILAAIKKRSFSPREKNSFEHDSFKNRWMTEEAWVKYQRNKIVVEWLNEEAHSVVEMGDISYRKAEDAKYFLRNTNFLVPLITSLTKSPSKADEFSKIIEAEPNIDKRYLKVLYRLNKALPFRLGGKEFQHIHKLLESTAIDYTLFEAAAESYRNGYIHIWLQETDPAAATKLPTDLNFSSFLKFIYSVKSDHPFYLGSERFSSPLQLMQKAGADASLWIKIAEAADNHQLITWFSNIGQDEPVKLYDKFKEQIFSYKFFSEQEVKLSLVQLLINTIDKQSSKPLIESDQKEIKLLTVEGNKKIDHFLNLKMANQGFTVAHVALAKPIPGISLDNEKFTFWSQNNFTSYALTLSLDASKLTRDKLYALSILINTDFQELVIPVEVKVVFPVKAYILQLVKYAIFGAIFFGLIRFIAGILSGNDSWLNLSDLSDDDPGFMPANYFSYFIALILFIGGLTGAVFLIKKIEKI